jgi:nicotinate-nucleotide adenylyltransferase
MKNIDNRIAILGGTFDPIHYGHLIMAQGIRDEFQLDRVIFMPSGRPPHKRSQNVSEGDHRYNMVCRAIAGNGYFCDSRIEIERKGYTYTVDTLKQLRQMYGEDASIFYIIGADVLHDLLTWKSCEEVFGICEFIAALRPGYDEKSFDVQMKLLIDKYCAKIHKTYIPLIDISSTMIRQKVKEGKSIKYLVPDAVESYIMQNGIY